MKWYSTYTHPEGLNFIIELEEKVGYFIYLYETIEHFVDDIKAPEECPSHQDDDYQDTLEIAKLTTNEYFGVPIESWAEIKF